MLTHVLLYCGRSISECVTLFVFQFISNFSQQKQSDSALTVIMDGRPQ
jgi:hypothetical protein